MALEKKYDIISIKKHKKSIIKTLIELPLKFIGKTINKANQLALKMGVVGWGILFSFLFLLFMFLVNKLAGPELKFSSEVVANVVRLRDGAEASMDFVMIWILFFFLLSVINDLWSMDYSQGPIKN